MTAVAEAVKQFAPRRMSTGLSLAAETLDDHPGEVLDLLAAATFDLVPGRNVVMVEDIFTARSGILVTLRTA